MRLRFARAGPGAGPPGQHTAAFGGIALLALGAARWFPFERFGIPCPLRTATGIPCLTCGMTTAMTSMARGELLHALAANPLGVILFFTCVATALYAAARFAGVPALRLDLGPNDARRARIAALAAVAANWVFVWSPWR
jgi:hypothetical protein